MEEAVRLIAVATLQAATDPNTGLIDMDTLGAATSSISRQHFDEIQNVIKKILRDHQEEARKGIKFNSMLEEVKKKLSGLIQGYVLNEIDLKEALVNLENENIIFLYGHKNLPQIRLISQSNF